jgi:methionyl-tRNA formyltransferase
VRLVFFGTPDWAVPSLEGLIEAGHEILAAVTRPDRPRGRGRRPEPCPVARRAAEAGIPLLQPETLKDRGLRASLAALGHELGVVVAYGRIIPRSLLRAPAHGYLNLHFSLLPRHRGAAPVQWALLAGDPVTGVTSMRMDPGLDTGPVYLTRETPVGAEENAGELGARLALMGAELLVETVAGLAEGSLRARPQDEEAATLAPPLRMEEAWLDWRAPALELGRRIRAFRPWPVARGRCGGREYRFLAGRPEAGERRGEPGEILEVRGADLLVACGGGSVLALGLLQPAGRKPMEGRAAVAGRYLSPGDRFEAVDPSARTASGPPA